MNSIQNLSQKNFLVNTRYDHYLNRVHQSVKFWVFASLLASVSCIANAGSSPIIQVSQAETFCVDAAVRNGHEAHHDTVGNACTRDNVDESVETNRDAEATAKSAAMASSDEIGCKGGGDSKQRGGNWLAGARIVETSNLQRP